MNTQESTIISESVVTETPGFPLPALLALIFGAIGIGFAPILIRLSTVGPSATGFWRVGLAFPVLALCAYFQRKQSSDTDSLVVKPSDYYWALFSGVFFGIDLSAWDLSIQYTTVANATLLCNLVPVFVALWSWLILKERVTRTLVAALTFMLIGSYMLTKTSAAAVVTSQASMGNMLGVLSAVLYTGYFLALKRISSAFSAYHTMAYSALGGGIVLLLVAIFTHETIIAHDLAGWSVLLGLALGGQLLGQGLIIYAVPFYHLLLLHAH